MRFFVATSLIWSISQYCIVFPPSTYPSIHSGRPNTWKQMHHNCSKTTKSHQQLYGPYSIISWWGIHITRCFCKWFELCGLTSISPFPHDTLICSFNMQYMTGGLPLTLSLHECDSCTPSLVASHNTFYTSIELIVLHSILLLNTPNSSPIAFTSKPPGLFCGAI